MKSIVLVVVVVVIVVVVVVVVDRVIVTANYENKIQYYY